MSVAMMMALGFDAVFGWPNRLYRRIGHPVTWIGALIGWCDARWNSGRPETRRAAGIATVAVVLALSVLPLLLIASALPSGWIGSVLTALLAWPFLAVRSLYDHVAAVRDPLLRGDIEGARHAVSMIVGRDPSRLDGAGVARAATESLAENASDGVIAPLFWGVLLGLPGIVAYKAINTMDSMIGHLTPRHADFGRAAARLDDVANWLPARLTGALFCIVAPKPRAVFTAMRRDAPHHRSPNAGWPEGAMAAALGVRLSGPRVYADRIADEPWLNAGAPDPGGVELDRALALYRRAMFVAGGALLALAWW
ncbi:cobalamin biosynthesis protein [Rhodobacteraceae bacterium THAF1]|uniref:adenosylcobinamide-phosphate synthase CbiB n=1 Tax=Palleronia sp. THAF1 TaxID=2587842 RepID=UPI000F3AD307|nr:adenosylcobinamide-phosphate synthase CbiB [Palleronia sp. THAF1]QFU10109.1 cobalamin biosynthesis protein [Palleronia sp. THAF1]VDC16986.1 cobalamin biosynthesis protein [Rhodobacteraceae bacterium THAF1]